MPVGNKEAPELEEVTLNKETKNRERTIQKNVKTHNEQVSLASSINTHITCLRK